MKPKFLIVLCFAAITGACSTSPAVHYVGSGMKDLSLHNILYCSGYSCDNIHSVGLSAEEWAAIEAVFAGGTDDPAEERRRVSLAVGLYETFAGQQFGTNQDRPKSPFLFNTTGQLDCVDEATNTSMFLHLLDQEGLLQLHSVERPAQRGFIIGRWFHSTAVLKELAGEATYAIDSWFYEPGTPAAVVPLADWMNFWEPEKDKPEEAKAGD